MQNIGATLVAVKRCSLARMWMFAEGSQSAHALLYLAAVVDRPGSPHLSAPAPGRPLPVVLPEPDTSSELSSTAPTESSGPDSERKIAGVRAGRILSRYSRGRCPAARSCPGCCW